MRREVKVGLQSVAGVASAVTPHTHTLCFDSVTAECHEPGMAPAAVPPHPHTLFCGVQPSGKDGSSPSRSVSLLSVDRTISAVSTL